MDGTPEGGNEYEPLRKERQVNVTVSGGGGGLVAACDSGFQAVAGVDGEGVCHSLPLFIFNINPWSLHLIHSPIFRSIDFFFGEKKLLTQKYFMHFHFYCGYHYGCFWW